MFDKPIQLDFVVDKLTNSIQNAISGDSFSTEILRLTKADLKQVTKKKGWNFTWESELLNNAREVFKLTISNNPSVIQGLLSLSLEYDHVYMHLLENAPFNVDKINFMKVFREIWLLTPVKYLFSRDLKGS